MASVLYCARARCFIAQDQAVVCGMVNSGLRLIALDEIEFDPETSRPSVMTVALKTEHISSVYGFKGSLPGWIQALGRDATTGTRALMGSIAGWRGEGDDDLYAPPEK